MNIQSHKLKSIVGLAIVIGLVALAWASIVQSEQARQPVSDTQMVLHRAAAELAKPARDSSSLEGDLDEAAGHDKKYVLVKKKPKHKKIKMEVFEPKMKYKKIKMKVPVKKMKKKKVKGYLVKKEHEHHHY